jgi:hypothetical protein
MDTGYTIPADICGDVKTDIDGLLDFARLHGTPLDAFRAAQFLSGGLHRRALAAAGSGPVTRRRNKALQQKAKRSAKTAKIRAARNDGRRRLVERTKAQTEFHDMDAIPESSDSDSDVPLSQGRVSTAGTTLSSLTTLPTPFATPIPDPQPSNSYHDDGESEAPLSESEEPMELMEEEEEESEEVAESEQEESEDVAESEQPLPESTQGRYEVTAEPRVLPKDTRHLVTKLALLHADEISTLLGLLLQNLESGPAPINSEGSYLSPLAQLAARCGATEADIAQSSFIHMRCLLQFTLWVE